MGRASRRKRIAGRHARECPLCTKRKGLNRFIILTSETKALFICVDCYRREMIALAAEAR